MSLLPSVLALGMLMGTSADQSGPKPNVEPKPGAKSDDAPKGRFILAVGYGRPLPRFASGGKWTRTEPFWFRVRLGEFAFAEWVFYEPPSW